MSVITLPARLTDDDILPTLKLSTLRVALFLSRNPHHAGNIRSIAKATGLSRRSVHHALADLDANLGLLDRTGRGRKLLNSPRFASPTEAAVIAAIDWWELDNNIRELVDRTAELRQVIQQTESRGPLPATYNPAAPSFYQSWWAADLERLPADRAALEAAEARLSDCRARLAAIPKPAPEALREARRRADLKNPPKPLPIPLTPRTEPPVPLLTPIPSDHGRIPGHPDLAVTRDGRVWHVPTGGYQRQSPNRGRGGKIYRFVRLPGKTRKLFVHDLVASAFCEQKSPKHNVVDHVHGETEDNHADRLEWVTHAENVRRGIARSPVRNKAARDADTDREIRRERRADARAAEIANADPTDVGNPAA